MMEFQVTGLENLPQISGNFEQLRQWLNQQLDFYNHLAVTPETIKEAKSKRADLNKLKQAIDRQRIDYKKKWLDPFEAFEREVKSIIELIDIPIASIDRQIKVFDEQRNEAKWAELVEVYNAEIGEYAEIFPAHKLINPKWRNVGESVDKLKAELIQTIAKCKQDLQLIAESCGKYSAPCRQKYIDTLDVSVALAECKRLEQLDKLMNAAPTEKPTEKPQERPQTAASNSDDIYLDVRFVNPTDDFKRAMRALCLQYGIKYGYTPKEEVKNG